MAISFKKSTTKLALPKGKKGNGLRDGKISLTGNKKRVVTAAPTPKKSVVDSGSEDDEDEVDSYPVPISNKKKSLGNGDLSRFDKLVNSHKKKSKHTSPSRQPDEPPSTFQRFRVRGSSPPAVTVYAPENISTDGGSSLSSMSSSSFSSSYSSSSGGSVPLDDSMSILSASSDEAPPRKPVGGKGMFASMTSGEAEEAEKSDLLAKFYLLKQQGQHISKTYTPKSNLNEMRLEMGRIEHERQVANAIKMNRRMLVAGVSAFETATDNYGPRLVKGKFHRVSHYVTNSIKDYDSAFERLSERYGGVIGAVTQGNPMYEIAMTLIYQMITYAAFYRGAETAKANEELTAENLKQRFPEILRQAVEAELAARQYQYQQNQQGGYMPPPPNTQQQQFRQTFTQPAQNMGMPAPSANLNRYMNQQQQQQQPAAVAPPVFKPYTNVNMENPASFARNIQSNAAEAAQQRQLHAQNAPVRAYMPTHVQPDTLISEMHRPMPHTNFSEEEIQQQQMESYSESLYDNIDGPAQAMSTRSGRPTEIIAPGQRSQQQQQEEEEEDDDYEEEFGSTNIDAADAPTGIVIDI